MDWVRPDPRVYEGIHGWEWVDVEVSEELDDRARTHWNTQRTLQAVGTGALVGFWIWWVAVVDLGCPSDMSARLLAPRCACIGFGAL